MEKYQKRYTVESLVELIRKDPDMALEEILKMPPEEQDYFLGAIPGDDYSEVLARAIVKNLEYGIKNKVETP